MIIPNPIQSNPCTVNPNVTLHFFFLSLFLSPFTNIEDRIIHIFSSIDLFLSFEKVKAFLKKFDLKPPCACFWTHVMACILNVIVFQEEDRDKYVAISTFWLSELRE